MLKKTIAAFYPILAMYIGFYLLKNALMTIFIFHLGLIFYIIFNNKNVAVKNLIEGWDNLLALLLFTGALLSGIIFIIFKDIIFLQDVNLLENLNSYGLTDKTWWFFFFYFIIFNPIIEELFWRSALDSGRLFFIEDFAYALYHSLVLYPFIHLYWLILFTVGLTAVSVVWKYVNKRTGGQLIPLITHFLADTSIVLAIYYLRTFAGR